MGSDWIDTSTDAEAHDQSIAFWKSLREDLNAGQFWADRIKTYRGEPAKRLLLAIENLPLPAAFREAAVATRALIREKRKTAEPFDDALGLLYWLAALRSFIPDRATRLNEPGFNVASAIPGRGLRSLTYTYSQLGYEKLTLLNKTDVKWLREVWGEAAAHTTLNDLHREIWDEYESQAISNRADEDRKFHQELDRLIGETPISRTSKQLGPGKRKGCVFVPLTLILGSTWAIWRFVA